MGYDPWGRRESDTTEQACTMVLIMDPRTPHPRSQGRERKVPFRSLSWLLQGHVALR